MIGTVLVIGLHLLCQVMYTLMMLQEPMSPKRRVLWLAFLWCVPILGIGIGGARFSRIRPGGD